MGKMSLGVNCMLAMASLSSGKLFAGNYHPEKPHDSPIFIPKRSHSLKSKKRSKKKR